MYEDLKRVEEYFYPGGSQESQNVTAGWIVLWIPPVVLELVTQANGNPYSSLHSHVFPLTDFVKVAEEGDPGQVVDLA